MLKKLINNIWKTEGQESITTPANQSASFDLMFKDLLIGNLSIKNGVWKFSYSDEFRKQNIIKPLLDFPDTYQIYQSNQLWPYFSYRIPGLNQPAVQEIIKQEKIDEKNEVDLLKRFGRIAVYNPFSLNPA